MSRSTDSLRDDTRAIWRAGVDAVRSERLVRQSLRIESNAICFHGISDGKTVSLPLDSIRRIAVVGAGKAGAGMAEAVENVLGPEICKEKELTGWVNVPADCVRNLQRIHLHAARAAGINEPSQEGVEGVQKILRLVESLGPNDLCLCLISGGGSALLPAPVEGITLADKLAVTQHLSAAGANIEQLNMVRKQLSRIKGGGLLRACRAEWMVSLIISDVLGDPLDIIASGPTVPDTGTPEAAIDVLEMFSARTAGISPAVFEFLEKKAAFSRCQPPSPTAPLSRAGKSITIALPKGTVPFSSNENWDSPPLIPSPIPKGEGSSEVHNFLIGNNATAVRAAGEEAKRLGYEVQSQCATQSEGFAEDVGVELAQKILEMRVEGRPACFISGGEPVVKLVERSQRGLGGRNQQLVLAALAYLADRDCEGIALLSGGTDGEDGPTDAAGAYCDAEVIAAARQRGLDPQQYLARNDAYRFFSPLDALIKTGPTHTNVCDVRVVINWSIARKVNR